MTTIHSSRTLGTLIRGRRLDRGLSQSDLADLVGVSRKWIGDIERGKPTAATRVLRCRKQLGNG